MYVIKNLTNQVQYILFHSGKDCLLGAYDSINNVRDSEITSILKRMSNRKQISMVSVKGSVKAGSKTDAAVGRESESKKEQGSGEKSRSKPAAKARK